jgi:hypothetical protein
MNEYVFRRNDVKGVLHVPSRFNAPLLSRSPATCRSMDSVIRRHVAVLLPRGGFYLLKRVFRRWHDWHEKPLYAQTKRKL